MTQMASPPPDTPPLPGSSNAHVPDKTDVYTRCYRCRAPFPLKEGQLLPDILRTIQEHLAQCKHPESGHNTRPTSIEDKSHTLDLLMPLQPRRNWSPEDERRRRLEEDPDAYDVTPHSVTCAGCHRPIRLNATGRYYAANWNKHKMGCKNTTAVNGGNVTSMESKFNGRVAAFRVNKSSELADEASQPVASTSAISSGSLRPESQPLPPVPPTHNHNRLPPLSSVLSEQLAMPPHLASAMPSGAALHDVNNPSHILKHWRRIMAQEDRVVGLASPRSEAASHLHSPEGLRNNELRSTTASTHMHTYPRVSSRQQEGLRGQDVTARVQSFRHNLPSPPELSSRRSENQYSTPESTPPGSSNNSPMPRPAPSMSPYTVDGYKHRRHISSADTDEASATPRSSPPTFSHLRKIHQHDLDIRDGASRAQHNNASRLAGEHRPHDVVHHHLGHSAHSSSPILDRSLFSNSHHYRQSPQEGEAGAVRARVSPPMPSSLNVRDSPRRPSPQGDRARLTSTLNPRQASRMHRHLSDHSNSNTPRGPGTVQFQDTPKPAHGIRNHPPPKLLERAPSTFSDGSGSESEQHRHRYSLLPSSSSTRSVAANNANRHTLAASNDIPRTVPWTMSVTTSIDTSAYGDAQRRERPQVMSTQSSSEPPRRQTQQLPPIRTTPSSAAPVLSMRRIEALPGYLQSNREADQSKQRSASSFAETHEASRSSQFGRTHRDSVRYSPGSDAPLASRIPQDPESRVPPPTGSTASPQGARELERVSRDDADEQRGPARLHPVWKWDPDRSKEGRENDTASASPSTIERRRSRAKSNHDRKAGGDAIDIDSDSDDGMDMS